MIEDFINYRENRHQEARHWKKQTGGKIIGVYCCNVPEEMIHAAGILPVRILGGHEETTEADLHFQANVCPFIKRCFDDALKGNYDYLDGLVVPNACNMVRTLYSFSKVVLGWDNVFFLETPEAVGPESVNFFREELVRFQRFLEGLSGKTVTTESITNSIEIYNVNRTLLQNVDRLRKETPPKVSGSEVQEIVLASMLMPKEQHSQLLEQFIKEINLRTEIPNEGVRLFISAGMLDNTELLRLVEDCGGNVVADDMPAGSRYFYYLVNSDNDPLRALAERYVNKIPCPRKQVIGMRLNYIDEVLQGVNIAGVIIHNLRACDSHQYEYPVLKTKFEQSGIPLLYFKGEEKASERNEQRDELEVFVEILRD